MFRTHFSTVSRRAALAGVLGSALAALGGCAVYSTPVAQTGYVDGGAEVYAPMAPPAPIQEVVTVQPSIGMVWLPGFWGWGGGRYTWHAGHWGRPPMGYSRWAPGHWQPTARGHVWRPGQWRR